MYIWLCPLPGFYHNTESVCSSQWTTGMMRRLDFSCMVYFCCNMIRSRVGQIHPRSTNSRSVVLDVAQQTNQMLLVKATLPHIRHHLYCTLPSTQRSSLHAAFLSQSILTSSKWSSKSPNGCCKPFSRIRWRTLFDDSGLARAKFTFDGKACHFLLDKKDVENRNALPKPPGRWKVSELACRVRSRSQCLVSLKQNGHQMTCQ